MDKQELNREEELSIFRKVCGCKKVVTSDHTNFMNGNTTRVAYYNQGISKVKLKEFIEKEGLEFEYWKTL